MLTRAIVLARRGAIPAAREALAAAGFDESVSDEQNRAMLWAARAEVLAAGVAVHRGRGRGPPRIGAARDALDRPSGREGIDDSRVRWCALRAGDRAPAERVRSSSSSRSRRPGRSRRA